MPKSPEELRSYRWFGPDNMRGFSHRSRMKQCGYRREDFTGKPVIAIVNTWSELNPCHAHLRERAEAVKRGVWQSGGFPVEIPAFSISETYAKPSPMLYRNMLAMEVEEALRSLPIDGAVLMGGCDKTTPGLLMGAISMDLPAIFLPAGPMLRGNWNGKPLGSGTDLWKYWTERCAGTITGEEWVEIEDGIARSPGFCMTMGTAATMTALAEALGFTLPGASSIPAADSNHVRMAMRCGIRNRAPATVAVQRIRRPTKVWAHAAGTYLNHKVMLCGFAQRRANPSDDICHHQHHRWTFGDPQSSHCNLERNARGP